MGKYYYKKGKGIINYRKGAKILSLLVSVVGLVIVAYVCFPLISWQIYFEPVFASQNIEVPIPKTTVVNRSISSLLSSAVAPISGDYMNADNWYPSTEVSKNNKITYLMSIPKINVKDAEVSSFDSDLSKHLVQFNTDTAPPKRGNTVIFGHSTLPQLFDPNNYKTIFANAYKLTVGDSLYVTIAKAQYRYDIQSVTIVEPTDTSVLAEDFSDSFITIITCTPPGTIWKRLIIKAKLVSS